MAAGVRPDLSRLAAALQPNNAQGESMKPVHAAIAVMLSAALAMAQTPGQTPTYTAKARLGIVPLAVHNPMPDDDITEVTSRLYEEFEKTGLYDVLDEFRTKEILDGLTPDLAACELPECAQRVGQMLQVEKVVVGNVTKVEIIYELTVYVVDVATGKVVSEHVEKVAGNMKDVAKVGTLCAVDALHEEKKEVVWNKGDWHKVRKHGLGGRLNLVMSMNTEWDEDHNYYTSIANIPVLGGGLHYDAVFQMKNGMEIHYTPNVELWVRQGSNSGVMRRVTELSLNIADFRWFFSGTYETPVVFYIGLGPALVIDFYYNQQGPQLYPPIDALRTRIRPAGNVLLGLEHVMKRSGWISTFGLKVKFWEPSVFQVTYGLTRPFGSHKDAEEAVEEEAPVPAPAYEEQP